MEVMIGVISHPHSQQLSLVRSDTECDRFYVNTGTWRDSIPATPDRRNFGVVKALNYVMLFASSEYPDNPGTLGSFNYWTGNSRVWKPREKNK
jgi:hypothetical protein